MNLASLWYVPNPNSTTKSKRIKVLPLSIFQYITPLCLAYWIMGDGYFDKDSKTVFLCTENFTHVEVIILIKVLSDNLGLICTTKRRILSSGKIGYRIRFSSYSLDNLRLLVSPHIIPSMMYKLGL